MIFDFNIIDESVVKTNAEILLIRLEKLDKVPNKITYTQDESFMFEFMIDGIYYLIELFNDNTVVYLKRERQMRIANDLSFNELINRLKILL